MTDTGEIEIEIKIGDFFLSGGDILIYVSGFSCGPSALKENNAYAEYYGLTFLNGKQTGKIIWREKEDIVKLLDKGVWEFVVIN
jgi:hypothetical protein